MKYFVSQGEDIRLDAASRSTLRGSFIRLSDGVTHYELSGPKDGEIIVLVGGLTVPLFYWDRIATMLHASGLRTLAYSSYGRGYSDRVKGSFDDALFNRQLGELVKALEIGGPYHVVGASMGALIAMGHVTQNADSVITLTIAGPAGLSEKPAALRLLHSSNLLATLFAKYLGRKWLQGHEANDLGDRTHAAELAAMLRDAYRYEGSIRSLFDTLQHFRLFGREALYQSAAESGVPAALVWGRDDRVTPIDKIDAATDLLKPKQCHVMECGHMVPFERPRDVADSIVSLVNSQKKRIAS